MPRKKKNSKVKQDRLASGELLSRGSELTSTNGQFVLKHQTDGNVVIYGLRNQRLWETYTEGRDTTHLKIEEDGNLVLYNDDVIVWHTGTQGKGGSLVEIEDDGNLTIFDEDNRPVWISNSAKRG